MIERVCNAEQLQAIVSNYAICFDMLKMLKDDV